MMLTMSIERCMSIRFEIRYQKCSSQCVLCVCVFVIIWSFVMMSPFAFLVGWHKYGNRMTCWLDKDNNSFKLFLLSFSILFLSFNW